MDVGNVLSVIVGSVVLFAVYVCVRVFVVAVKQTFRICTVYSLHMRMPRNHPYGIATYHIEAMQEQGTRKITHSIAHMLFVSENTRMLSASDKNQSGP